MTMRLLTLALMALALTARAENAAPVCAAPADLVGFNKTLPRVAERIAHGGPARVDGGVPRQLGDEFVSAGSRLR